MLKKNMEVYGDREQFYEGETFHPTHLVLHGMRGEETGTERVGVQFQDGPPMIVLELEEAKALAEGIIQTLLYMQKRGVQ